MLTYKKDDFDESLEDIMQFANDLINKNKEDKDKNKRNNKEELEKNGNE